MPQAAVDPVVLAAMIIVRLRIVVSRETAPGESAVLIVGSVHAGSKGNVIPDSAVLQLNLRTYDEGTREVMLRVIRRIVTAECQASDEDFSDIPNALGVPYTYWGIGGIDPSTYQNAVQPDRVAQDIPGNHSPAFAQVVQPTLDTGVGALVVAALAWLGANRSAQG